MAVIDVKGGHSSMLQEPFVESLVNAITPKVTADSGHRPLDSSIRKSASSGS
jgi:hypothetical protein